MNRYEFILILAEPSLSDDDCDALYAAGCDDATVVTRNGVTHVAFGREAESLEVAIASAVTQVRNAGLTVMRAEIDDPAASEALRRVVWEGDSLVQQDELQEYFSEYFSHFVALSGCYHAVGPSGKPTGDAAAFHCSGFVLSRRDQWYWITAGHVIDQLDEPRRKGEINIDRCVLNDSFAGSQAHGDGIPFDFQDFDATKCYDTRLGLDFCAIELGSHYRQLLEANRVVPLSERNWDHKGLLQCDHYFMIGLPQELENTNVTLEADGYHISTKPQAAAVYVFPVEEQDVPKDCAKPVARFVGRVDEGAGNIVGMSGSPIFGVREDDESHYLIAVQRSWLKSKGLVFGCPIGEVIVHLTAGQKV